jgi:glycosyltransferase involved in cell wall biosynthesis
LNLLFIHQNAPGQFRYLINALIRDGRDRIVCVSARDDLAIPGVGCISYPAPGAQGAAARLMEAATARAQAVAGICVGLARNGWAPDVVVAHSGWGESLFVKDVYPRAQLLHYCEFFYRADGADAGFDPAIKLSLADRQALRLRNAPLLMALEAGDAGMAPSQWQKSLHPPAFQSQISVIPDGVDVSEVAPDSQARFVLPDGRVLRAGDPVVTYVARALEPHRGFPSFLRALPAIMRARPDAQIVVLGASLPSYGPPPSEGGSWRAKLLAEMAGQPGFDRARLHLLGTIQRPDYLRLLQVSAVHVYLTMPFVLSWSALEAMAAGALMVASDTAPVTEVINDGRNGLLVDFFDPAGIAARVLEGLGGGAALSTMRTAARQTVVDRFRLEDCVARQRALIARLAS